MQVKECEKSCKDEDSNEFNDEFEFEFDNDISIRERTFVTCKEGLKCIRHVM